MNDDKKKLSFAEEMELLKAKKAAMPKPEVPVIVSKSQPEPQQVSIPPKRLDGIRPTWGHKNASHTSSTARAGTAFMCWIPA